MPARWTPTPTGHVARRDGPSPVASFLAAAFTFTVSGLALLIVAAMLVPDSLVQRGQPGVAAAANPSPAASPSAAPLPGGPMPFLPSPEPTPAPSAPPSAPPGPVTAVIAGAAAPVQLDARSAVQVRVEALKAPARSPIRLAPGRRMMVAVVRMDAQERGRYDASHWFLEDTLGKRWKPLIKAPTAPMEAVTVRPDGDVNGQVAFSVPTDREIVSVVLTDGAGWDLAVFDRTRPAR